MASTQVSEYVNKMSTFFTENGGYTECAEIIFGYPLMYLYNTVIENQGTNRLLMLTYTDFMKRYNNLLLSTSKTVMNELKQAGCVLITDNADNEVIQMPHNQIVLCLNTIYNAVYSNFTSFFINDDTTLNTTDGMWIGHTSEFTMLCFIKAMCSRLPNYKKPMSVLNYRLSSKYCQTILELCDEFKVDDDNDNEIIQHLVYNILESMIAQIALNDAQSFVINEYFRYNEVHTKLVHNPNWKLYSLFVDINKAHLRYQRKGLSALYEVSEESLEEEHECDSSIVSSIDYKTITTKDDINYIMRLILSRLVPNKPDTSSDIYQITKYVIACIQDSVC